MNMKTQFVLVTKDTYILRRGWSMMCGVRTLRVNSAEFTYELSCLLVSPRPSPVNAKMKRNCVKRKDSSVSYSIFSFRGKSTPFFNDCASVGKGMKNDAAIWLLVLNCWPWGVKVHYRYYDLSKTVVYTLGHFKNWFCVQNKGKIYIESL